MYGLQLFRPQIASAMGSLISYTSLRTIVANATCLNLVFLNIQKLFFFLPLLYHVLRGQIRAALTTGILHTFSCCAKLLGAELVSEVFAKT